MKAVKTLTSVLLCLCLMLSLAAAAFAVGESGLVTENGKTYYYKDGVMQTGLQTVGDRTYYFSVRDGHQMKDGWVNAGGGKYYYCAADGHIMKDGRLNADGKTYYVDAKGLRRSGFITIGGSTYYFSPADGHMMRGGALVVDGKSYVLGADGAVISGPARAAGTGFRSTVGGDGKGSSPELGKAPREGRYYYSVFYCRCGAEFITQDALRAHQDWYWKVSLETGVDIADEHSSWGLTIRYFVMTWYD